jgi:hypothetical protein
MKNKYSMLLLLLFVFFPLTIPDKTEGDTILNEQEQKSILNHSILTLESIMDSNLTKGINKHSKIVRGFCFDSEPQKARVYLIPMWDIDKDSTILDDKNKLMNYYKGNTPLTISVEQRVYMVLFILKGKREIMNLDVINDDTEKLLKATFK